MEKSLQYTVAGLLLFLHFLHAEDSFISHEEYAQMLYKNPRGIGCHKCHGEKGEGQIISKYVHRNKIEYLIAPRINNLSKEKFYHVFSTKQKIMPTYFLTDEEKAYIYYYLIKQNKKGKDVK